VEAEACSGTRQHKHAHPSSVTFGVLIKSRIMLPWRYSKNPQKAATLIAIRPILALRSGLSLAKGQLVRLM
jgi:hypothetical protein